MGLWPALVSQIAAFLLAIGSFVGAWITSSSKRRRIENVKLAAEARSALSAGDDAAVLDRFIDSELAKISSRLEREEAGRRWYSRIQFSTATLITLGVVVLLVLVLAPAISYWARDHRFPDATYFAEYGWTLLSCAILAVAAGITMIIIGLLPASAREEHGATQPHTTTAPDSSTAAAMLSERHGRDRPRAL